MLRILKMNCASCGANLEIKPETNSFTCGYCGASQMVERHGGTVELKLAHSIARVQVGTDKTAAELAIVRLQNEIAEADAAYKRAVFKKNTSKDDWTKYCLIAFFAALVIILIFLLQVSGILVVVLWVLSLAGIGYVWHKRRRQIDDQHTPQIKELYNYCNLLRQRLADQKKIVNR